MKKQLAWAMAHPEWGGSLKGEANAQAMLRTFPNGHPLVTRQTGPARQIPRPHLAVDNAEFALRKRRRALSRTPEIGVRTDESACSTATRGWS